MLQAVAPYVMIIVYVHWWSWARLYCVWKLPNLSKRPVSELKNTTVWKCRKIRIARCENSRFYPVLAKIRIKNPDNPKIVTDKNVRNQSYHRFYPVWAKIWINL